MTIIWPQGRRTIRRPHTGALDLAVFQGEAQAFWEVDWALDAAVECAGRPSTFGAYSKLSVEDVAGPRDKALDKKGKDYESQKGSAACHFGGLSGRHAASDSLYVSPPSSPKHQCRRFLRRKFSGEPRTIKTETYHS